MGKIPNALVSHVFAKVTEYLTDRGQPNPQLKLLEVLIEMKELLYLCSVCWDNSNNARLRTAGRYVFISN